MKIFYYLVSILACFVVIILVTIGTLTFTDDFHFSIVAVFPVVLIAWAIFLHNENKNKKDEWLIWSIEHQAWWMPDHNGYTKWRSHAGIYSYNEALEIVEGANIGLNDEPNEAMIEYVKEE